MNIYVKVYLDKNLGDDLMLVRLAQTIDDCAVLFIHCESNMLEYYTKLLSAYENVRFINCPLRKITTYGKGYFKIVLLLGGSVLMGTRNKGCWYRFLNVLLFKRLRQQGTKYAIVGCNTGPFINKFTEYFVKLELRQAELITTRDKASFRFIKNTVKSNTSVSYFPDMLMSAPENIDAQVMKKGDGCCISVHGPSGMAINGFLSQIANIYIAKTNNPVTLICFDSGTQNDIAAAKDVFSGIVHKEKVEIIENNDDHKSLIARMAKCDRVLAVRFHAMILAISLKIPFLAISYSNKTENCLSDIGEANKILAISDVTRKNAEDFANELIENPIMPKTEWQTGTDGHLQKFKDFVIWYSD
jgi:polysaccharide pyruvyl transferase WcaK-like protein